MMGLYKDILTSITSCQLLEDGIRFNVNNNFNWQKAQQRLFLSLANAGESSHPAKMIEVIRERNIVSFTIKFPPHFILKDRATVRAYYFLSDEQKVPKIIPQIE